MKKSELYEIAIRCVIDDKDHTAETKIDVLEMLLEARSFAAYSENLKGGEAE